MRKTVILIGSCPGGGKGTQTRLLSEELEIPTAGVSELMKPIVGRSIQYQAMQKGGQLWPDHVVCPAVEKAVMKGLRTSSIILLEGFPRTQHQARLLSHDWKKTFRGVRFISIWLEVPDSVARPRIARRYKLEHREDDQPESVDNRFLTFHDHKPYIMRGLQRLRVPENGMHQIIDGNRPSETVCKDIRAALSLAGILQPYPLAASA